MEDLTKKLYALIPLILIIVFSWLFSYLASRLRKPTEQGPSQPAGKRLQDHLLDLLPDMQEEQAPERPQDRMPGTTDPYAPGKGPKAPQYPGGPVFTPDPIKPKWWGA